MLPATIALIHIFYIFRLNFRLQFAVWWHNAALVAPNKELIFYKQVILTRATEVSWHNLFPTTNSVGKRGFFGGAIKLQPSQGQGSFSSAIPKSRRRCRGRQVNCTFIHIFTQPYVGARLPDPIRTRAMGWLICTLVISR